jgi:hypothetical protein
MPRPLTETIPEKYAQAKAWALDLADDLKFIATKCRKGAVVLIVTALVLGACLG